MATTIEDQVTRRIKIAKQYCDLCGRFDYKHAETKEERFLEKSYQYERLTLQNTDEAAAKGTGDQFNLAHNFRKFCSKGDCNDAQKMLDMMLEISLKKRSSAAE